MSDLVKAIIALVILGAIGDYVYVHAEELGLPQGLGLWDASAWPARIAVFLVLAAIVAVLFVVYRSLEQRQE